MSDKKTKIVVFGSSHHVIGALEKMGYEVVDHEKVLEADILLNHACSCCKENNGFPLNLSSPYLCIDISTTMEHMPFVNVMSTKNLGTAIEAYLEEYGSMKGKDLRNPGYYKT